MGQREAAAITRIIEGLACQLSTKHALCQRDDMGQVGWEAALQAASEWDGRGTMEGYVLMRAAQRMRDYRRKVAGRAGQRPEIVHAGFWDDDEAGFDDDPTDAIDSHLVLERLDIREMILMRDYYLEDWTQKEIADCVGLSRGRISQIIKRAIGKLQRARC